MNGNYGIGLRERQDWIDFAKGIGIILVVWAHTRGIFTSYIVQFHMPLFFFISGYLYKYKGEKVKDYINKKAKGLLVPFWFWNLLLYPVYYILYYWGDWNVIVAIKEVIEIVLTLYKVPFLGATWFLAALFWISTSVNVAISFLKENSYCDYVLLTLSIIVAVIGFNITFPYKLSRVMICSLFYVLGYMFKKYIHGYVVPCVKNIGLLVSVILFWLVASNNSAAMGSNQYSNKILFIIGALAGTVVVLRVSELVLQFGSNNIVVKHITYIGKNSMDIVIWQFLAFRFAILLQIMLDGASIKDLVAYPVYDASGIWLFINVLAGIYGSLMWRYILNHNPLTPFMKKIYVLR